MPLNHIDVQRFSGVMSSFASVERLLIQSRVLLGLQECLLLCAVHGAQGPDPLEAGKDPPDIGSKCFKDA